MIATVKSNKLVTLRQDLKITRDKITALRALGYGEMSEKVKSERCAESSIITEIRKIESRSGD